MTRVVFSPALAVVALAGVAQAARVDFAMPGWRGTSTLPAGDAICVLPSGDLGR